MEGYILTECFCCWFWILLWVQVGIDGYILFKGKYHTKHSSFQFLVRIVNWGRLATCKRVSEMAKLMDDNKTKESIMSQKRSQKGSYGIWWISNSFLKYSKPAIPPLFNGPELLSSASDKATLSVEIFSKYSNLDDWVSSLLFF